MTTPKDFQTTRPHSAHRLSINAGSSSNLPARHPTSRHHSHSVSSGAVNPTHRVTRRKSINASAVNNTATIRALLQDDGSGYTHHRSFNLKNTTSNLKADSFIGAGSDPSVNSSGVAFNNDGIPIDTTMLDDSAIADDWLTAEGGRPISKTKTRRASEGSHLVKGEGKRSNGELKCEKCGKGYKHSSCLTKHLWEHTPEWSYTSKLAISKHQQVQLLEAASVLVGMNQDEATLQDSIKSGDSDNSSSSPAASGTFEIHEDENAADYSSAETTPPPSSEHYAVMEALDSSRRKRYSGNSSSYSRSYQSAPSSSLPAGSVFGQYPPHRRPSTSGATATADEEEASLAAAVEYLCNFGTPKNGPVLLPPDVPPVPPLPARYAERYSNRLSGAEGAAADFGLSTPPYQNISDERDVKMSADQIHQGHQAYGYDDKYVTHERSDEDDDGVFGSMEGINHDNASHS